MNIHEYQAKALLKEYGVNVLRGQVAYTPEEAEAAARKLNGPIWVVKAQVHAGGRGKGGGVRLAKSVEETKGLFWAWFIHFTQDVVIFSAQLMILVGSL